MLDFTKPIQTRDGREVRIHATDGGGAWPVHGAIYSKTSGWQQACWRLDGRTTVDFDFPSDLVSVPLKMIKRRVYVSTYGDNETLQAAGLLGLVTVKVTSGPQRITSLNFPVDIEIPEGYGL